MRLWPTPHQLHLHEIALLMARASVLMQRAALKPVALSMQRLLPVQGEQILQLHQQMGHRMTQPRLQQRFANGLHFVAFREHGELLGSTWVAVGTGRYVDELNWYLPIGPQECWLRDVFVVPAQRGRALLTQFAACLARDHVPGCTAVWSDVDWVHKPSMRAHAKAGFELHARVRALDLAGRVRLRSALPPWHRPVTEIAPARRWINLAGPQLLRHQQLMA